MATLKQPDSLDTNRFLARMSQSYTGLVESVARLFGAKQISVARIDPLAAERAAQLFAQAQDENSNLECDWLWYATNMTRSSHKRYCLRRALEIDPNSEMARRMLAELALHEHR